MLDYTDSAVTRNASEKKINSLLDFISASSDLDLLQVSKNTAAWGLGCTGADGSRPRTVICLCQGQNAAIYDVRDL